MMWLVFLIIGFLVGLLVISTGGGGAAIYLGLLTSIFGLAPAVAASTSLFTAFPSLVVGAYGHYRTGQIHFKVGNQMLLTAIPATVVGALLAPYIPNDIYTWIVAIILTGLGIQVLVKRFLMTHAKAPRHQSAQAAIYGLLSGIMVGVAGLSGGGPIIAGLLVLGLDMLPAAATSSYVLVGTSLVGLLFHLSANNIDWQVGTWLMIGAVVGALCAPRLLMHVDPAKLNYYVKPFMGVLLIFMGLRMLF
ncbi:sulfite exporter TauE/SafE family protein [Levilactobacillus yiduensis]|uniref:sulfite exporter TauE/SafE family protein n=1 Tax=Levilactobacillus yiduensis TaxID=2953880 RepID=UPI000EF2FBF0|nr:sulfite exporter TauE/SafE family protein [Levilactobacillus yiduensis]AYM01929.1 sulfite exporter TauE/SafE family protein [Levilactobacillus brevis]